MNILIIGCATVGTELAMVLDAKGHDVSVVDATEEDFDSLPDSFSGFKTIGVPIDTEVLKRAGIQTCDALFAVTSDDDTNIMVSQLAKRIFSVPKIFARIRDIRKGEIFEEIGIRVVCPTRLTVAAAVDALEERHESVMDFDGYRIRFQPMDIPEELVGITPNEIEYEPGEALFAVIREGSGIIMYSGQPLVLAEGDKLIFARKD